MLGQPCYLITPKVVGFRLSGSPAGRGHRNRPRAHHHRAAACPRGGRELRGVLRRRAVGDLALRPRHGGQHGARVRRHHGLLSGGCRDPLLSPPHRPERRGSGPGRGVHQAPGPLPDRRDSGSGVHRRARARPGNGGAQPRGSEAPAGPGGALRHAARLPRVPERAGGGARLRARVRAARPDGKRRERPEPRPRRGGDRGDHLLHEHLEPGRDARRGSPRTTGGRARAHHPRSRQDLARPGFEGGDRVPAGRGTSRSRSRISASTWWATGAQPASGTAGRCPRGWNGPSRAPTWWRLRSSPGTATSRAACTRACAPTTWRHRRWSSPMRLPAPWTSIWRRTRSGPAPTGIRCSCAISGRAARTSGTLSTGRSGRRPSAGCTATSGTGTPPGTRFRWTPPRSTPGTRDSTYIQEPPFFSGMTAEPAPPADIRGARVLVRCGDSVTTDHISPAGTIAFDSPAGSWLRKRGIERRDFNSYGSRRGNDRIMLRGTFANIRFRNQLAGGAEGGFTVHYPSGEQTTIFEAAKRYREEGTPLVILAGKEYGTGLLPRLGRQGHPAAGRQGGDRRELRAHPPQQSGRHGRPAARVPGRRERGVPRVDRRRGSRHRGRQQRAWPRRPGHGDRHPERGVALLRGALPTRLGSGKWTTTGTAASCRR